MNIKRAIGAPAALVCLGIGAMAGISSGSAAPTHAKARGAATTTAGPPVGQPGPRPGGAPAIHSVSVVPNKQGTGFDTVTVDSGSVQSISSQQLTLSEGTKSLTYKTVTLTIPSGATVQRDGKSAQLSELQPGDHVTVFENSNGTSTVNAFDSSFKPTGRPGPGDGPPPGAAPDMPPAEGSGG